MLQSLKLITLGIEIKRDVWSNFINGNLTSWKYQTKQVIPNICHEECILFIQEGMIKQDVQ